MSAEAGRGSTRLASVFRVHRFVAGVFGALLFAAPDLLNHALHGFRDDDDDDDDDITPLPLSERLYSQSWGCFVLAVAIIVHAAPSFPPAAQRQIGEAMIACFALLSGLYGRVLLTEGASDMDDEYFRGVAATGCTFVALLAAYSWAMLENRDDETPIKRD